MAEDVPLPGMEVRELTYGEKAVGLTFNPSGDPTVRKVKELYAQIIDLCNDMNTPALPAGGTDRMRNTLVETAIAQAILAQMAAVKLVTWKS